MLDVRLLGVSEVRRDGAVVAVGGRQPRAVLAALALADGRAVTTEELIRAVWGPAPPRSARATLQSTVSRLRQVLGEDHQIDTVRGGYRWSLVDGALDVTRFRRLVRRAAAGSEPWRAAVDLRDALGEWRGPALADLRGSPIHTAYAALLEQERVSAEVAEAEALIVCGQADEAARRVVALIEEHPLDERLRAAAIRALAAAGQVPAALHAYDDWRRTLAQELGTSPSAAVLALHEELVGGADPIAGRTAVPVRPPEGEDGVVGRAGLVEATITDLRSSSVLSLHGGDGVGLTTVGRRIAAAARDRFDRAELLPVLAGGAWLACSAARQLGLVPDPADDLQGAMDLAFRSRPVLLVLDDVTPTTVGDARALALRLTAVNTASRVVLLHRSGAALDSREVPPLPHGDERAAATQLVLRLARSVDAWDRDLLGPGEARELAAAVDGSPLAALIATRTLEVLPLAKLLPELRERAVVDGDPLTAAVEIALTTLPEPAGAVLRMLACVDAGLPPEELTSLAARAGAEPGRAPLVADAAIARGLLVWSEDRSRLVVPRGIRRRLALDGEAWRTVRAAIARGALALLDRETVAGSPGEATWLRQVRARYPDLRSLVDEAIAEEDLASAARLVRGLARWWEVEGDRDDADRLTGAVLRALPADATVWRAGLHEVRGRVELARRRAEDGEQELRTALSLDPTAPMLTIARRERLLATAVAATDQRRQLLASAADRLDGQPDPASRREHAAIDLLRARDAASVGDLRRSRGLVAEARRRLVGVDAHDLRLALDLLEHRLELPPDAAERDRRLAAQHHELTRRSRQAHDHPDRLQLELDLAWREVLLGALGPAHQRLTELCHEAERVGSRRIGAEATALAAHLARCRHELRSAEDLADDALALDVGGAGVDALVLATRAWVAWRRDDVRGAAEAAEQASGRWPTPPAPHPLAWASDLVLVALGSVAGRLTSSLDAAGRCVAAEPPWLPSEVRLALARHISRPTDRTLDEAVRTCRTHHVL